MNLTDSAKFRAELLRISLAIMWVNLKRLEDEMENCTPEEHEALERAIRLVDELDDKISEVLESVRRRKGRRKKNERGEEG